MPRRKKSESDQNANTLTDPINQETPGVPPVSDGGVECEAPKSCASGGCVTKKSSSVRVATTYNNGGLNLDSIEVLNGYVIVSISDQQFVNDGTIVGINPEFNPLDLRVGDTVLFDFGHQIAIDSTYFAVKFDHIIAKINLAQVISNTIESVMEDDEEDLTEEIESIAKAPISVVEDEVLPDVGMESISSTISIELPTPKSAPPKNSAVVNKTGKPLPQEGVRQLNRPIRR